MTGEPAPWVAFLAQDPGQIERVLEAHRANASGWCVACSARPRLWPCDMAKMALQAQELLGEER